MHTPTLELVTESGTLLMIKMPAFGCLHGVVYLCSRFKFFCSQQKSGQSNGDLMHTVNEQLVLSFHLAIRKTWSGQLNNYWLFPLNL